MRGVFTFLLDVYFPVLSEVCGGVRDGGRDLCVVLDGLYYLRWS